MGIFNNFVNSFWRKNNTETVSSDATKQPRRDNSIRDFTDSLSANIALTRGLYHNTYPGMKLAGGLAFAPIAVPVWFMGLPIPTLPKDDKNQAILDEVVLMFANKMKQIHIQSHRDGTVWVWPHYSARAGRLIWEFIPDDTITDIIRDLESGDIIEIIASEQIRVTTGKNMTSYVTRERVFNRSQITETWTGAESVPGNLKSKSMRNQLGILPIPFANNSDGDEVRGHSDYERILSDLKNYHDVDLAFSTFLAKFAPKMVQNGVNVKTWLDNNGFASIADIDIQAVDFIYNGIDEKTEFVFPSAVADTYIAKLKNTFRKIVEASGVPEIVWGLKTEGNRASVEESMDSLIKYVQDKRDQKAQAYQQLFSASLAILAAVNFQDVKNEIEIKWNKMDAVSEEVRSIIFRNYMQGIGAIVNVAGMTKEQLYKFYKMLYPQSTEETIEEFKRGLSDMGGHVQWTRENYTTARDLGDESDLDPIDIRET
jgi:hypothetical protein